VLQTCGTECPANGCSFAFDRVLTGNASWQVVVNSPEQGGQMGGQGGQMGGQMGGQTAGQMGSTGQQTNSEVDTPFGA